MPKIRSVLASAARLPHACDPPPGWLLPHQIASFARALAALRRHGTACVADPVGSGKTYVALAVAAAWRSRDRVVCLVPAVLVHQWAAVAARLSVRVELHSHECVSRGRLPSCAPELIIIDESHRFRVPSTRRYRTLAPWLVGRSALLLTGTPVVNRPADLLHQLRLTATDDTLASFGVPSLGALLESGRGHPALGRLIVVGTDRRSAAPRHSPTARPRRILREIRVADTTIERLARELDALRLSAAPDVAALVRSGLLRALASSPAAFRAALGRYRGLLRHAADATAAGRPVTRRDLRLATGADEAQLVLWALLDAPTDASVVELDPDDLPALDALIVTSHRARADPKAERLVQLLHDARRSIVFVTHRATVVHLRAALSGRRVAWCTGAAAGIGQSPASRRAVLSAFDPAGCERGAALDVLVATDVAAEGLDLQRAERIVHYDLPWTPMRLRQREGRAVRLGSPHPAVEVALFRMPEAIERRLGVARALRSKERWPARLGLDRLGHAAAEPDGAAPRRLETRGRDDGAGLARQADAPMLVRLLAPPATPACRAARTPELLRREPGTPPGELIVAAVAQVPGFDEADALLLWRRGDGIVVSDPVAIVDRLWALELPGAGARRVSPGGGATAHDGPRRDDVVAEVVSGDDARALGIAATRLLRDHLGGIAVAHLGGTAVAHLGGSAVAHLGAIAVPHPDGTAVPPVGGTAITLGTGTLPAASAELVRRLARLAGDAARARDQMRLDLLDRALQFLRRGHTAGEAMLAASLGSGSDAELIRRLTLLPRNRPQPGAWRVAAALAVGGDPERAG